MSSNVYIFFSFCVLLAFVPYSIGSSIYVSPVGSDSGDGSLTNPYKTIKTAVEFLVNTSSIDRVLLLNGTHTITATFKYGNLSKAINIIGVEDNVIISKGSAGGPPLTRYFELTNATLKLSGKFHCIKNFL